MMKKKLISKNWFILLKKFKLNLIFVIYFLRLIEATLYFVFFTIKEVKLCQILFINFAFSYFLVNKKIYFKLINNLKKKLNLKQK